MTRTAVELESLPPSAVSLAAGSWRVALLLVALGATAVVMPMFFLGNASGHDFQFHISSWLDVAGQWHEGIAYPRWAEWANWGFGEPRFVFYPPISWTLGATLGTLLPWKMAPGAFIWLALILAGLAMWKLAREWLPAQQAVAAAIIFEVNPYHLVMVYYRSDFAELLASALFPLVLWGAVSVTRDGWRRVPELAIVFALIWLSNAPAAVIATYSLVLLLPIASILQRNLRPLLRGGAAMAAGFGLGAFYILPAAYEQRWVQITEALAENLRPYQNFLFTRANNPEFVLFNLKISCVAVGMILTTGVAAVFAARRRREFPELWWMLLALAAISAFLMFPVSALIWLYLPKLRFVQFPWRWLVPLSIALACFIAAAAKSARAQLALWTATAILIGATAVLIVCDAWWDSEDIPTLADAVRSGHGYEGTDEYAPLGCNRYILPGNAWANGDTQEPPTPRIAVFDPSTRRVVSAGGLRIVLQRWSAESKVFSEEASRQFTLALLLVNYPPWEVLVDGADLQPGSMPRTARMLIPLAAGTHRVEVKFQSTWDRTLGGAISGISALALLAFAVLTRRRKQHAS